MKVCTFIYSKASCKAWEFCVHEWWGPPCMGLYRRMGGPNAMANECSYASKMKWTCTCDWIGLCNEFQHVMHLHGMLSDWDNTCWLTRPYWSPKWIQSSIYLRSQLSLEGLLSLIQAIKSTTTQIMRLSQQVPNHVKNENQEVFQRL